VPTRRTSERPRAGRPDQVLPCRHGSRYAGRRTHPTEGWPTLTEWILLGISLLLVLACGGFVAAEFALVTVDRSTVDRAAEGGDAAAAGVRRALRSLSTQLSGAQVGITVTNLAIGFLAEPAIAEIIDGPLATIGTPEAGVRPLALALALAISTALTMIFGELVPKNLAIALPLRTARATQAFMRGFTTSMSVPIRVLNGSANALVRRLGLEPQEELRSARNSTELASLISRSADQGTLDADTAELMERSVEFGTRTAGEIMTPRVRTSSLDATDRASEVIELARQTGHSRFPVLDDEDAVVGTVHVKHAVALPLQERSTARVKHIMVKPIVVPDSIKLDPLLALLRRDGFQMAVVLDEYGGHAGIVTLEDVVEEIVGDIADEHDRLGSRSRQRRDGSWSLSGLLRPDEVEDITSVSLPEDEDYDTIAGLVLQVLGRIPLPGDVAEVPLPTRLDDDDEELPGQVAVLRVEHMDGLRIDRVRLSVREEGEQP
jgi:CBS domain containing-hemolysin-like protein